MMMMKQEGEGEREGGRMGEREEDEREDFWCKRRIAVLSGVILHFSQQTA